MHSNELPTLDSMNDVSLDWLQGVLVSPSSNVNALLASIRKEPLGTEKGFTAELTRIHLDWKCKGTGPESIIIKMNVPNSEKACLFNEVYEREYLFYKHLSARSPIPSPHCYYAAFDSKKSQLILVLEDLVKHESADQINGTSDLNVELAISSLARIHAYYWNDLDLVGVYEKINSQPSDVKGALEFIGDNFKKFKVESKKEIPYIVLYAEIAYLFYSAPGFEIPEPKLPEEFTLIHGDYKLDNIFFNTADRSVVLIDWGGRIGLGCFDLLCFFCGSLTREQIQSQGLELLGKYHKCLLEYNVNSYSKKQLESDIGGLFYEIAIGIAACKIVMQMKMEESCLNSDFNDLMIRHIADSLDGQRGLHFWENTIERTEDTLCIFTSRKKRVFLKTLSIILSLRNKIYRFYKKIGWKK